MRTILINFLNTLRRFKLATVLNIIGLSLAFASFILILIQTNHDLGFDRFHPKTNRIFRLEVSADGTKFNAMVGRNWAETIKNKFPQIEATGLRMKYSHIGDYLKVEHNGTINGFIENVQLIDPDFTEVFDFDMVEGERNALRRPGQILLPASAAKRFFGNESALGRRIVFNRNSDTTMVVGGVYRDFPKNTLVENAIYYGINPNFRGMWDGWQFNYELYVTLIDSSAKEQLEKALLAEVNKSDDLPGWVRQYKAIRFTPLPEIYYQTDIIFDSAPKGSRTKTNLLFSVSLLIIFIASFNFVNFSISLVPMRIGSINIRKVLGSSVGILRWMVIAEAVGICFIAFFVALLMVYLLGNSPLATHFSANIGIGANMGVVMTALAVALIVGAIAGIYPALYSTRLAPALVLKGNFGLSPKGRMLRTGLISLQYIISIVLIICAVFMQLQNRYLRTFDTGYDTEQIVVAKLNDNINIGNRQHFINELKKSPQIRNVAFSQFLFGTGDAQAQTFEENQKKVNFAFIPVSSQFPELFGIKVSEGRSFKESDEKREPGSPQPMPALANKAFMQTTGVELGYRWYDAYSIVGVIDNINFRPLQFDSEEPLWFVIAPDEWMMSMPWAYFRIDGDPYSAVDHIRGCIASIDPTLPVDITFYDSVFNSVYQNEERITELITLFSLLAIGISLVGIFGLVFFETQYRRKEIGVRKVYGSTIGEIICMFNLKYARIVAICFIAATPVACWIVIEWLKEFAYRTPIYWWVFALTLAVVACITALIATLQSWQAATANPVDSIKTE